MDFEGLFLAEAQINADADSTNALCADGCHRLLAHRLLNINLLNPWEIFNQCNPWEIYSGKYIE